MTEAAAGVPRAVSGPGILRGRPRAGSPEAQTGRPRPLRSLPLMLLALAAPFAVSAAEETADPTPAEAAAALPDAPAGARQIDLPTTLRLAGARDFEIRLAEERAELARAEHAAARQKLYPWFTVGAGSRRHWGRVQTVEGDIIDAAIGVQTRLQFGEARFGALAADQRADAARFDSESQRQDSVLAAEAGVAFQGDVFRARAQAAQDEVARRQAEEQVVLSVVRLAARLRLDPAVDLVAADALPEPLDLVPLDRPASAWMSDSMSNRAELHAGAARLEAARIERRAARHAPLYPTIGAGAAFGGLGGGRDGDLDDFGDSADFTLALSWSIGPGGLFDRPRGAAAASRERAQALLEERLRENFLLQVAEAPARLLSLADQIGCSARALEAAEQTLRLSRERREFAVGVVAETVLAAQEAARARRAHFALVAEFNKARFLLRRAGGLNRPHPMSAPRAHPGFDRTLLLLRLMVGAVFLSEGVQKFLFAESVGSGRFARIGLPSPELLGPLVGGVEAVCGALVLLGCATRPAVVPLLGIMAVAVWKTKLPILGSSGFWKMAHDSRTDFCMTIGALALLLAGGGAWSLDAWRRGRRAPAADA